MLISFLLFSGTLSYCWIVPKIDRVGAVEENINELKRQELERIYIEAERGRAKNF